MTAPLTPLTLEGFRAALSAPDRNALLAAMADELRGMGDALWIELHSLAIGELDDESDTIDIIEDNFAEAEAREQFDNATYAYECRTGKDWSEASTPFWDSKAWIARRAAELRGVAA